MTEPSPLRQYTKEILAITCPLCGAEPLKRCKPSKGSMIAGNSPIRPHAARRRAAELKETE